MEELPMTIAEKLYKLRNDNGLSQKEFADKIGASQSAVNYWENGNRQPRITQIKKIAKVFDIALYILLDDTYPLPDITSEAWKNRARFTGDTEMNHPPRFTAPISEETQKDPTKLHRNSGVLNEEYLDKLKFNGIIQKKKRGGQLTSEEQIFHDAYQERGLRQALEAAIKFYFMLNDDGKKKADDQITYFIEQIELLTKVPEYQKKQDD